MSNEILGIVSACISILASIITLIMFSFVKSKNTIGKIDRLLNVPVYTLDKLNNLSRSYLLIKRLIDIVAVVIFLIMLLPLNVIIIIVLKLEHKGSVLTKQKLVGANGRIFGAYKFRTMAQDCYSGTTKYEYSKFGLFLYKTSLNEMPLVLNVLRGEMSFVGRSNYIESEYRLLPHEIKESIKNIKPGITNLWSISRYKREFDISAKPKFDIYYAGNISLWLDMNILIKTVVLAISVPAEY